MLSAYSDEKRNGLVVAAVKAVEAGGSQFIATVTAPNGAYS